MSREHKLALIVGFAFVLVVGVLLSDHFSSARKARPGSDIVGLGPREAGGSTMNLSAASDSRFGERVSIGEARDRPYVLPESTPRSTQPPQDYARVQDPLAGSGDPAARSGLEEFFEPVETAQAPPRVIDMSGGGFNGAAVRTEIVQIPGVPSVPGPQAEQPVVARPQQPPVPPTRVQPPARTYTVKEGDSLFAIARRELGDGMKWTELRDLNRSSVGSEGERLKPGMKITLPSLGGTSPAATTGTAPASAAAKPAGGGTYTIQRGDALSVIAQKTLGSSRRWPELVAANKGVIDDPDSLPVGAVIRIPAR